MERMTFVCDAPGCSREMGEGDEVRLIEVTTWGREYFTTEKMHACSPDCEARIYQKRADRFAGSVASPPSAARPVARSLTHPKTLPRNRPISKVWEKGWSPLGDRHLAFENGCLVLKLKTSSIYGQIGARAERGWYVIPGKKGLEGAGWFATRERAQEGLERLCVGPFTSIYAARHARGGDRPYPPRDEALRDLTRLAGVEVDADTVRNWNEEQRCEVEAWASFTLSDRQFDVRRAPPMPSCLTFARRQAGESSC